MQHRVQFDFDIEFSNGGGLQGQGFRLDIDGDDISDAELIDYIVRDLRLLMVGPARILNKRILVEAHKRKAGAIESGSIRYIDLSHTIEDGLVTYPGMPPAHICDYLSRERSRDIYEEGTEFQIGRIDMVANTGTYIDCPSHRYADGKDLSEIGAEDCADLDAIVVRVAADVRAIDDTYFRDLELRGRAVLVHTGWDVHFATAVYGVDHPFLTESAAVWLRDCGVKLVGIDSVNIDDTRGKSRPVHSTLLGAGILIVEHLRNLAALPDEGFSFSAVPPKVKGMGTFPVRALAKFVG
ncbi:cyclase family protein [Lysobacter sp. ISL-42]|nr:cyclase family protein [Lysobacter sp. ISL-42]MBT2750499.1 cyclase family protein [Lysobacter sp. ISL-50]MBT2776345.1 cyclase family protein [Lysobacter sp. ISL-54]MBT2780840.1 cyclase family protein [Lysobacter sp. ISL-52]